VLVVMGTSVVVGVASDTGQTVVETATMTVVTWPSGQLVTVGAHEVTVMVEVL
jgi:hypothetical protein